MKGHFLKGKTRLKNRYGPLTVVWRYFYGDPLSHVEWLMERSAYNWRWFKKRQGHSFMLIQAWGWVIDDCLCWQMRIIGPMLPCFWGKSDGIPLRLLHCTLKNNLMQPVFFKSLRRNCKKISLAIMPWLHTKTNDNLLTICLQFVDILSTI